MNYSRATMVFLVAALAGAPVAYGQQRQINTDITSWGDAVTYSTATETYVVGYKVTVSNTGNNTVNNVRFEGESSVTGSPDLVALYKGTDGITCSPVLNSPTKFTCQLGTAPAGYSKTFSIFFYSPVYSPSNPLETRTVNFNTTTIYAEGTNDNPNNPPANDTRVTSLGTVTLGTASPAVVKSALTPDGGTFFTAPVDQFQSKVIVPPQQKSSSVRLEETISPDPANNCSPLKNFNTCYRSEIEVPNVVFAADSGQYLTFTLRVGSSNIRKGSKIGKVVISYTPDPLNPSLVISPLQFCTKDGNNNPLPNSNYEPCIAQANDFTRKGSFGFFGYEWIILNLKNGYFDIF